MYLHCTISKFVNGKKCNISHLLYDIVAKKCANDIFEGHIFPPITEISSFSTMSIVMGYEWMLNPVLFAKYLDTRTLNYL